MGNNNLQIIGEQADSNPENNQGSVVKRLAAILEAEGFDSKTPLQKQCMVNELVREECFDDFSFDQRQKIISAIQYELGDRRVSHDDRRDNVIELFQSNEGDYRAA